MLEALESMVSHYGELNRITIATRPTPYIWA